VASGFTDAESREIFAWAQKNKVGEDTTYVWVKPEKIMEVQWERTSIKEMPSYKYSRDGYEKVEKRMSGTVVKPRFIRWRTDKSVNPNDLRLSQIPDWGKMKKMALRVASKFAGFMTVQSKTWREIEAEYEKKYGKNHHRLALECVKCGGRTTCRCSTPKTLEKGVCYYCTGERQRPEPLNFDKEE
jgi:hypothetical protein